MSNAKNKKNQFKQRKIIILFSINAQIMIYQVNSIILVCFRVGMGNSEYQIQRIRISNYLNPIGFG